MCSLLTFLFLSQNVLKTIMTIINNAVYYDNRYQHMQSTKVVENMRWTLNFNVTGQSQRQNKISVGTFVIEGLKFGLFWLKPLKTI